MKDLIERYLAERRIDEALSRVFTKNSDSIGKQILDRIPSAQPEIIRCKDCKWGAQDEVGRWFCRSLGCQIGNEDGSWYCADAERRTDNANANA